MYKRIRRNTKAWAVVGILVVAGGLVAGMIVLGAPPSSTATPSAAVGSVPLGSVVPTAAVGSAAIGSIVPSGAGGTTAAGSAVADTRSRAQRDATAKAGHGAFVATQQAVLTAVAQRFPAQLPPAAPSLPASCPVQLPAASSIRAADTGVPHVRNLTTQAAVVVGQELYELSSGVGINPDGITNTQQGVISVYHPVQDTCAHRGQQAEEGVYRTPGQHGAVTLTAIAGPIVQFRTADGTTGSFNVVTKQFS